MRQQRIATVGETMIASADTVSRLAGIFREAGSAHHQAFLTTNGDDPEWPIWYAEFLQPRLNALLGINWTKSEVVYLLVRAEKERTVGFPHPSWPEFYARLIVQAAPSEL
jgi:hypothetical protein